MNIVNPSFQLLPGIQKPITVLVLGSNLLKNVREKTLLETLPDMSVSYDYMNRING